jgi:hypothetical protein
LREQNVRRVKNLKGLVMGQVKLWDEHEKEEAFKHMVSEMEAKREIELIDKKIEALERDWLESQSNKYTKILSEYALTFDELDADEKYELLSHTVSVEEIAIQRGLTDEFKLMEAFAVCDFSKKEAA